MAVNPPTASSGASSSASPLHTAPPPHALRVLIAAVFALAGVACLLGVVRDRLLHPYVPAALPPTEGNTLTLVLQKATPQAPAVVLELIRIPAGSFTMGSPDSENERDVSEGPQHHVTIGHDFFLGKFEVTQAQWQAVMNENQSNFRGDMSLPAEQVSWGDCQKFCDEVARRTGRTIRLPTEAEWEYAARAGTTTPFYTGAAITSTQANFNGTVPYDNSQPGPNRGQTMVVGSFAANPFGLFDTAGNVDEWCQDVYHDSYEGAPADGSAWMKADEGTDPNLHVYRGGAYNNDAASCRSAVRFAAKEDTRANTLGFRVAADVLSAGNEDEAPRLPGGQLER